jgi:hypothetical protein
MTADRITTTVTGRWIAAGYELRWGNEALIIPAGQAEAIARHILAPPPPAVVSVSDAAPVSDAAKAALAVAEAR